MLSSHLTTLACGTFAGLGAVGTFKPLLPTSVSGVPKSVILAGMVALNFIGFHAAGKMAERALPANTNDSYLTIFGKFATRTLAQAIIGSAFFAAQVAAYEFSGLLGSEPVQIRKLLEKLLGGEIDLGVMLKIQELMKRLEELTAKSPRMMQLNAALEEIKNMPNIQA